MSGISNAPSEFDERILSEQERLNKRGLATAWILPGEKMPKVKEWNRQSMLPEQHKPGANLAIQCGALSGNLVCVDFDRPEVVDFAIREMPHTPMKDGRPSKPLGHWYYRVTNIPPEFRAGPHVAGGIGGPRIRHLGESKIDFVGTGGCVVCPPSIHASGEIRIWGDPDGEPAEIDFLELWECVRSIAIEFGWVDRSQEAANYISRIKAKSGQGGHSATFHAASALVAGFLLNADDAIPLLKAWNETNADPRWSDSELLHKLDSAISAAGTDPRFPPGYLIRDGRAADDPTRLADGFPGVWKCWNGSMFKYDAGRYEMVPDGEIHAELRSFVESELGKAYSRALYAWEKSGKKGKQPGRRQVNKGLVSEVLASLQMRRIIPGKFEMPCLLPDGTQWQWLALRNGILDLVTGELREHTPDWFATVRLGYDFEPSAQEPRLEEWLSLWFGRDKDLIATAQEWAGYSLIRSTDAQAFLLMVGDGGNGKGAYSAMLEALVGSENCSFQSWNGLGERFGLAPTLGKLLNIADEVGEFDKTIEGVLRWYTAGKPIEIEFKGKTHIETRPTARLVASCNTPPRIADRTDGMWRRMILLPFSQKIPADRRIVGLDKATWWAAKVNMAGVLNWALAGLSRLRANNCR